MSNPTDPAHSPTDSTCLERPQAHWMDADPSVLVLVSQYGFNPEHPKIVNCKFPSGSFEVINAADERVAYSGELRAVSGDFGLFWQGDFSQLKTSADYYIRIGAHRSPGTFSIAPHLWDNLQKYSAWYYFGLRRIGEDSVMGNLGDYRLVNWEHGRVVGSGGSQYKYIGKAWGDGDDGRIYPSASLVVAQYCALKETNPFWDRNDWIYSQVRWGLDGALSFLEKDGILRFALGSWPEHQNHTFDNRFYSGDEKLLGDCFDQEHTCNEYHATENHEVVYSSLLIGPAYAACLFRDKDPEFFDRVGQLVQTGYNQILYRFNPHPQKYSLGAWIWLNLLMWKMTGESSYRERAVEEARRLMELQQSEHVGKDDFRVRGWYHKDPQTNRNPWGEKPEQEVLLTPWIYQGLIKLIEYCPDHPQVSAWRSSVSMYARDYLMAIGRRNAFGFTPMKVEASAQSTLKRQCGGIGYQYFAEIGRQFHQIGNAAFMLQAGNLANDQELIDAAWQQVFWFSGNNPFGIGLIHGFGKNNSSQQHHQDTLGRAFPGGTNNGATGDEEDNPQHERFNEYYTYANLNVLWLSTVIGATRFEAALELWPKEITEAPHTKDPVGHARASFPIRLKGGFQYPFMAVLREDPTQAVVWSVNGVPGGSAELGIITPEGVYQAPPVRVETKVKIGAASLKEPSIQDETPVMILPAPAKVENLKLIRNESSLSLSWEPVPENCLGYTVWRRLPKAGGLVGTIFEMVGATNAKETSYRFPNETIPYYDQEMLPEGTEFIVKAYNRTPETDFDYGPDRGGWKDGVWTDARAGWMGTQNASPEKIYGFGPASNIATIPAAQVWERQPPTIVGSSS